MRLPLTPVSAALLLAACATSPPRGPDKPAAVEVTSTGTPGEATAVRRQTLTATVKSVDVAGRAVTLEWDGGKTGTFQVAPEVTRFDDMYAGDAVRIEVEQQLRLEVQPAGSAAVPVTVAGGTQAMAGGMLTSTGVQATVTVTAVDLASRIVKFQDPAGATYEVKAGPGLRIEKLRVGDRLLATYVEARAVRLEKVDASR